MFLKDIKATLPFLLSADLAPCLVGTHGIGKTEVVKQFAKENDHKLIIVNLGNQDTGDLIGLPEFSKDQDGTTITKFMIPDWVHEVDKFATENPDKFSIIFFDEVNRARRDVLQAIFSVVLEKRIHTHQLAGNVKVMFAMNPNDENYTVTDLSDNALLSRMAFIKVLPSKPEFFEYATTQKVDNRILSFFKKNENVIDNFENSFSYDIIKPNRRSIFAVDRLLKTGIPTQLLGQLLPGIVGIETASPLLDAITSGFDCYIKFVDVMNNLDDNMLADVKHQVGARMDMLKETCDELVTYFKEASKDCTKKQGKNIVNFLLSLPKELCYDTCRRAYFFSPFSKVLDSHGDFLLKYLENAKNLAQQD